LLFIGYGIFSFEFFLKMSQLSALTGDGEVLTRELYKKTLRPTKFSGSRS
jgi:hypothetical protein